MQKACVGNWVKCCVNRVHKEKGIRMVEWALMLCFLWMGKAAYIDKDVSRTIFWGVLILATILVKGLKL